MTHASLFSGIGGFDLAAEQVGWTNLFNCEIDEFCRRVLDYHFSDAYGYTDVKRADFREWRGKVDVLSGGFPCQPFSTAGKRLGTEDDRYLWPELLRAIDEIRPTWVVGENVAGLLSMVQPSEEVRVAHQSNLFGESVEHSEERQSYVLYGILQDLEERGYSVQTFIIPACAVGAPHRRDRVWIVAHSTSRRWDERRSESERKKEYKTEWSDLLIESCGLGKEQPIAHTEGERHKRAVTSGVEAGERIEDLWLERYGARSGEKNTWEGFPTKSPICGEHDGIPRELDSITFPRWRGESIKAYGNAIVPEVARRIFLAIREAHQSNLFGESVAHSD